MSYHDMIPDLEEDGPRRRRAITTVPAATSSIHHDISNQQTTGQTTTDSDNNRNRPGDDGTGVRPSSTVPTRPPNDTLLPSRPTTTLPRNASAGPSTSVKRKGRLGSHDSIPSPPRPNKKQKGKATGNTEGEDDEIVIISETKGKGRATPGRNRSGSARRTAPPYLGSSIPLTAAEIQILAESFVLSMHTERVRAGWTGNNN
ncbi:hypothetical protein CALVIDRAFT_560481 [Calocera viscosa TUFC12733]|uniref:Uncharacterized protein n=1 Tax=Calocera viscosa (strain TUFC12733) TaxID=1330018 RepID=A0A167R3B3_CALVF|nr:hypothetical protein CALVIDRAFT_560481 [Calocera viscosa TUFC12733]